MPLTHGVSSGHSLLVPESVSSQLTMPPLRMSKMSLLPKSRSPAEIFGRSTLSGLIEALARRDNEGGTQGANLDFRHCIPPEGWLVAAANHYAARPGNGSRHLTDHVSQEHQDTLLSHSYLF